MKDYKVFVCAAVLIALAVSPAYAQSSTTRQIALAGTTSIRSTPAISGGAQDPGFDPGMGGAGAGGETSGGGRADHGLATEPGPAVPALSARIANSNPELNLSFNGVNAREQRFANNAQQFTREPPDQGLCVGNGYVLETVNTVLRVYDTNGNALAGLLALNTFYGYPPENPPTGEVGPGITDPVCYFDPDTQRWFHLVVTFEKEPRTGADLGPNHLDLAVSQTSSPLGAWNIYKIPAQNDGTEGTPNHHCLGGPCFGDYPKIGADAYGIYIATNELSVFPTSVPHGFRGAQIYAISKQALAKGLPAVTVIQFDTADPSLLLDRNPGATVWPATTPPGGVYAKDLGGTEYFLSSVAEFNGAPLVLNVQSDNRLRIWALSNTQSLDTSSPALTLRHGVVNVQTYAVPPQAGQKAGNIPLADCLNDTTVPTPFGVGCWRYFSAHKPPGNEIETQNMTGGFGSQVQQVVFAGSRLWTALNTALDFGHDIQSGIAYFVIEPFVSSGAVGGNVLKQGYLGLAGNNLTYPAVGVTAEGKGVISFTLLGADHYPSAAYATLDASAGAGDIHIVAEGLGPEDGFTSYKFFSPQSGEGRYLITRWGDYGATAVDGKSIWIGSEYIGQTCTLAELVATLGSCGGTRTSLTNWYTRISKITP